MSKHQDKIIFKPFENIYDERYILKLLNQKKKKYFRTKDSLYARPIVGDIEYITKIYNDIVKEADTIKELCDEFVAIKVDMKPHTVDVPYYKLQMDKDYIEKNGYKIYGAIWTEKGLIYVAKMNEEGEFELI